MECNVVSSPMFRARRRCAPTGAIAKPMFMFLPVNDDGLASIVLRLVFSMGLAIMPSTA